MYQSLPYSSTFSPHIKFSWKAHTAKILLREIFPREPFITRKFPYLLLVRIVTPITVGITWNTHAVQ